MLRAAPGSGCLMPVSGLHREVATIALSAAPGGEQMTLQMAYFDRGHQPVIMDIGR